MTHPCQPGNPPLRSRSDVEALWKHVLAGDVGSAGRAQLLPCASQVER